MPNADDQMMFDRVVAHARAQKVEAKCDDACRYRTPDGLKCFAGCLIPDEMYLPEMEGNSARTIATEYPGIFGENPDLSLLARLQRVHDDYDPAEWEGLFQGIAQEDDLTYNPPIPEAGIELIPAGLVSD